MPGQKISTLSAVSFLQEADQIPIVREGINYKITGDMFASIRQLYTVVNSISSLILPTYADNATALVGGLSADTLYKTATGEVRIVV